MTSHSTPATAYITERLSLMDLDRVLRFFEEIPRPVKGELVTHMKVGEDSFALPTDFAGVRRLAEHAGGFGELDYMVFSALQHFTITADFSKNELRIKAARPNLHQELVTKWHRMLRKVPPATELASIAVPKEGRSFILSCLNEDGSLASKPGGPVTISECYAAVNLQKIGLGDIARRFVSFLVTHQNKDGGWGTSPNLASQVKPTASSLMVLSSWMQDNLLVKSAISKGVKFLRSRHKPDGSWSVDARLVVSILAALALIKVGVGDEMLKKAENYIAQKLSQKVFASLDPILIEGLMEMKVVNKDHRPDLYFQLLDITKNRATSGRVRNTIILSSYLALHSVSEPKGEDRDLEFATRLLLRIRNRDGGWPRIAGKTSELFSTLIALSLLQQTTYLR